MRSNLSALGIALLLLTGCGRDPQPAADAGPSTTATMEDSLSTQQQSDLAALVACEINARGGSGEPTADDIAQAAATMAADPEAVGACRAALAAL